jgi:hypothetical protein
MAKSIKSMTKEEILACPVIDWKTTLTEITSIVLVPTRRIHDDSGYRCIVYVFCREELPIGKGKGSSDVLYIEGISGYGINWLEKYGGCPKLVPPTAWSIDCLPKSGLFRLFTRPSITVVPQLSSVEVFQESE